ncbi:MAG: NAD-dependent epimerase/dehydratase family protein [Myxococcales bacterium]|nr:NAD-dependent epimerase/dehydratase family protein [Myxococcales bacterium]
MRPSGRWKGKRVLVTGGASFIGSHLVDALVARGASVRVVDDLSSGSLENLERHLSKRRIDFQRGDLREPAVAREAGKGIELVFHLAADHGGRGYVDTYQAAISSNLVLDGVVFRETQRAGVEKIVYASSGCVYPNYLQGDLRKRLYLTEDLVRPPYDADNLYGWAKLMGELTLRALHRERGLRTASCRYFTVYGPRGKENHAVMAMIAKAFVRQDPFEVWGTGRQIRNWTYVEDIVAGTLLAAERIDDGTAVNLGTMERIQVLQAVKLVLRLTGHRAEIALRPEMPTGPLNRVAHNGLARRLLGWKPRFPFREGLGRTVDWYFASKRRSEVERILRHGGLLERKVAPA